MSEGQTGSGEEDRFRDVFKHYKRRKPPPDLSHTIDVSSPCPEVEVMCPQEASQQDQEEARAVGLTPQSTWKIYSLTKHPGLVIIRNPFTSAGQLMWIKRCLRDMPSAKNKTNLTSHGINLTDRTWWQLCRTSEGEKNDLRRKLRWVTLGYHHNWDTKEYSEELRGDMPCNVVRLCGVVGFALGLGDFTAQAAIINYYHHDSTLGPHTDHSEPYAEAPLFSFSFGQRAVFLIGGPTKATEPTAVMVCSGDVVVMAGSSRLCYHAVPRIVLKDEEEEEPWITAAEAQQYQQGRKTGYTKKHQKNKTEEKQCGKCKEEKKEQENKTSKKQCENFDDKTGQHKKVKTDEEQISKTQESEEMESEERIKLDEVNDKALKQTQENEMESERKVNKKKTKEQLEKKHSQLTEPFHTTGTCDDDTVGEGDSDDNDDLPDILDYVRTCRINMNIRQVLPPYQDMFPS